MPNAKRKPKQNDAKRVVSLAAQEPPQVRLLAVKASALPAEFAGLAEVNRIIDVQFTPAYLDGLTIEQETELCKSGLRFTHALLGPLLIHLRDRRKALKHRDWESFCRINLGYTHHHCNKIIAQAKRIAKLQMTEDGRRQLESEREAKRAEKAAQKEEQRIQREERKADTAAHKRAADAKAKQDAEELKRRRSNERALEAKPSPAMVAAIAPALAITPVVPFTQRDASELKDIKAIRARETQSHEDEIQKLQASVQTLTLANTKLHADLRRLATSVVKAKLDETSLTSLAQTLLAKYGESNGASDEI